jgi:hypothetical protein
MAARADALVGGFAGSAGRERVEQVAGFASPVWQEEGTFLEVGGTFVQTEAGEGSVFVRLLDVDRPLILVWHSAAGFQLVAPGSLPRNTPSTPTAGEARSVTWRLRVRSLRNPAQRLVLETRQGEGNGWQVALERTMALAGVRAWVEGDGGENGGVLTVGIAGPVALVDAGVRVVREGSLLMVR